MTAFDAGWAVLKMPLLTGSISPQNMDTDEPTALFEDPTSGRLLPMMVSMAHLDKEGQPYTRPSVSIPHEEGTSEALFYPLGRDFQAEGVTVVPEMQRRGMATAMYDLMAILAARDGGRVVPSRFQTEEGRRMWRDKAGFRDEDAPESGPIPYGIKTVHYPDATAWPVITQDR